MKKLLIAVITCCLSAEIPRINSDFGGATAVWIPSVKRQILTNPTALNTATWVASSISSVTKVVGGGPVVNGLTIDAWQLTDTLDATTSNHLLEQTWTNATATYNMSSYVKAGTLTWVVMTSRISANAFSYFNLTGAGSTGQTGSAVVSNGITSVGGGWYRIWAAASLTAGAATAYVGLAGGDGMSDYHGTGTGTILTAAPQLEWVWQPNLLPYSEQLFLWTNKTRSSVTSNATTAPNGMLTAAKVTEDNTAASSHLVSQNNTSLVTGEIGVFSIYAKAAGRTKLRLAFQQTGFTDVAYFDITAVSSNNVSAGVTASITSVGSGWYLCSIKRAMEGPIISVEVDLIAVDGVLTYNGDGSSGLYLWGAQLTRGPNTLPYSVSPITTANPTTFEDSYTGGFARNMRLQPRLMLGPELVVDGGFTTACGAGTWTCAPNVSISGGVAIFDGTASGTVYQSATPLTNHLYQVSMDILTATSNSIKIFFGGGTAVSAPAHATIGHYTDYIIAGSGNNTFALAPTGNFAGSVDNLSIKEVINYPLMYGNSPNTSTVNWPTFETDANAKGIKMATSQYLTSPLIPISLPNDWSVLTIQKMDGGTGAIISLGNLTSSARQSVVYNGSSVIYMISNDGTNSSSSGTLTVPATSYIPLLFTSHLNNLSITRLDLGTTVSLASLVVTGTTIRIAFGTNAVSLTSTVDSLHTSTGILWSRAVSTTEAKRHCRTLQQMLARPEYGGIQFTCQ